MIALPARAARHLALIIPLAAALGLACAAPGALAADTQPGAGVEVVPLKSSIAEETFQTLLVMKALEALGYDVKPIQEVEYAAAFIALAHGDGTFMADNWDPQQAEYYAAAGGDAALYRKGVYVPLGLQGYLMDKKTADAHGITSLDQLKDPDLAALFDHTGDGKADLTGCNPGWYCKSIIEHHIDTYGLRDTVSQNSGAYAAVIADTITRYKAGEPVLYYGWTPYWTAGVLVPGKDVIWLTVPFSAMPDDPDADTAQANGADYGFMANDQRIVANRAWAEANPAAATLFGIMRISSNDVSAQNRLMRQGEDSETDIMRHADAWIAAHQETWDGWLTEARAAAE
ncbi:glycine betaine/L-proline ABC transporter substrate-binding protein ProX [Roseospira marina]|uniref:Glycine betaine/L-proline ABC transporter substrate-binding protein ProX n=1 Tax=Roseospira marina TaxID=140057 RepID=A0A5M6IA85_9PROT|nr:glycine betaine/L-proline ABC transporter substrate-binding protein ProX [Roseospira marina]KAA5605161.1 glycine betaine/L-proline ABC transporter substrate-binding protein ProX [Roseospira marina]MBB4314918.1 glycine betaine/proline transport system substrate-binding protein [Roseospira marina]MBB5087918.1 glycine betaine/proline transport system substrate-binding protein [Roseospira marina]